MRRLLGPSMGLLGQILAILLLTLIVEFGVSTLLYERASQFSVRDDEARRLAEHLVISRHLLGQRPPAARPAMAAELTTDRYLVRWAPAGAQRAPIAPALDAMRRQVIDWEPGLRGADLSLRVATPGQRSMIAGALRLPDGSAVQFRTREPVTNLNLAVERVLLALVPALALMVLGGLLVRRTLLPLRRLARAADRVGSDAAAPIAEDGAGEVRRVIRAFNRMQARIGRLIADRTQALAAVGHDLRTPLARLRLRTEDVADAATRAVLARDIGEMDAMIASLLAFLGGDAHPEAPARVDVAVMAATLVDDAADGGRDVIYEGPDHGEWVLRPLGLKRALGNLLDNALHHGERVTVRLHAGEALTVTVEDDGPGIPDEALVRVTEPFVRLDTARRRDTVGFGLGLAIVQQAVAAEGGTLHLSNRAGGGLRAVVFLPGNHSSQSGGARATGGR